tara:strand:- start:20943 stop:21674 length:732 start_codon:yes stop_codon:yes gene_type:complete
MAYPSITLEQIVSSAFIALDVDDSRDELVFKEWAWDALREIGPSRVDKKTKCIPITNLCAMKPHDYLYGLDMNILDDSGQIYYYQMAESGVLESEQDFKGSFDTSTDITRSKGSSIKVAEQKEAFVFSSNASKSGVTKMEISYYSYPVDEYGEPLVEEKMKEAIITYIEYRYLKRERRRRVGTRDLPLAEVADARDEWKRQRMAIRGDIKMPDPLSADTMFRRWVSGIPNFKRRARNSRITRF